VIFIAGEEKKHRKEILLLLGIFNCFFDSQKLINHNLKVIYKKIKMKKFALLNFSKNPELGLFLIRISLGIFFLSFGAMKLIDIEGVGGFFSSIFGIKEQIALYLAWFVALVEVFGGLILLLGVFLPKVLYRLAVLSFMVITLVGYFAYHLKTPGIIVQGFWHAQLLMTLLALVFSPYVPCPFRKK
jgi:uncharacterized membrane protein YphA (DoxX/SURF4 family)